MWVPQAEYNYFLRNMPVLCVDLVVRDHSGKLLMLKRENQPAKGEWWFPGGRVLHGELRANAAFRKLKEECGLTAGQLKEWKTLDILLQNSEENYTSHAVSTLYLVSVSNTSVKLDRQSSQAEWASPEEWKKKISSPIIFNLLNELNQL
jgi:colanic acid biosynthesis protein WcaH